MTAPVTVKPKRYVFVCAGCDLLAFSERSDALTCSPACRVRAHRNGNLKLLRADAERWKVHPAILQRAGAVLRLRPDLGDRVDAGEISLDDVRADMWDALMALVRRGTP